MYTNLTVNFTEISKYELIVLMTSVQEKKLMFSMPISFFTVKSNESKLVADCCFCFVNKGLLPLYDRYHMEDICV